ncbi:helix-turn-helix domain-containing protein [Sulfurimonas aquatica]|nr:helix-turn-helix transcriptional regulator [Sulfurimonas aquatica]
MNEKKAIKSTEQNSIQTKLGKALNLNKHVSSVVGKKIGKQVVPSKKPQSETIKDLMTLGEMIKYKRTKSKLSIKKTAQLCGISDKTLRTVENGGNINTLTLMTIINMLGLKMTLGE